jgi:Icc protein
VRLVWITDPHLNHVSDYDREAWFQQIASHGPNGVVISGDISEGDGVVLHLAGIADRLSIPIYFVLGNHDFYKSSIRQTRQRVVYACRQQRQLIYLTDSPPIVLGDNCYLVGEDGWGDATEGDYENSYVRLNDFRLIDEFIQSDPIGWKRRLQELGSESATRLKSKLDTLPGDASEVLVVTHVPPFRESCWYEGRTTDDHWAPFFVCGQVGNVLLKAAESNPERRIIVLCGHAHHAGIAEINENLVVHTGAAEYGKPSIEATIELTSSRMELSILR